MALRTLVLPSGDLFTLASQQYGDATQWDRIAAVNGMTDPFFVGPITLLLPPADPSGDTAGGS